MLWNEVRAALIKNADKTLGEKDRVIPFGKALEIAEERAKKLKNARRCAILCKEETEAALWLLVCFAAKKTAIPLSERYGKKHCDGIIGEIRPDLLLSDGGKTERLFSSDENSVSAALIMCTSGTTGKPKGVVLSEENILTNVFDIAEYFGVSRSDTILISRPLYHCAVLTGEFLVSLLAGADIRFYSGFFEPLRLPSVIKKYGATVFCGTPTLLSLLAATGKDIPLKKVAVSGECMDKKTGAFIKKAFPTAEIHHVYGLTEASPRVAALPPRLFEKYPDFVGYPLRHTEIKLLPDGKNRNILWVKGKNVTSGYYKNPAATAAKIKDGWLCTGDVAEINGEGLLKIFGRSDDMIIKGGMNIYPSEIEEAVKADRRVREAAAYGYRDKGTVKIGLLVSGNFSSVSEVYGVCRENLPPYEVPNEIFLKDRLERNGSGKIMRKRPDRVAENGGFGV